MSELKLTAAFIKGTSQDTEVAKHLVNMAGKMQQWFSVKFHGEPIPDGDYQVPVDGVVYTAIVKDSTLVGWH